MSWQQGLIYLLLFIIITVPAFFISGDLAGEYDNNPVQIKGSGSSFCPKLYQEWGASYVRDSQNTITYDASTSQQGLDAMIMDDSKYQFAGFDGPLSEKELTSYSVYQIPTVASGVVFFYNIPSTWGPDTPLNLTFDLLLGIYNRTYTHWKVVLAANPTLNKSGYIPPTAYITPAAFSTENAATLLFTQALCDYSPLFRTVVGCGENVTFPSGSKQNNYTWPYISSDLDMIAYVQNNPYSIGYSLYPIYQEYNQSQVKNKEAHVAQLLQESVIVYPSYEMISQTANLIDIDPITNAVTLNQPINCTNCWPFSGYTYFALQSNYMDVSYCDETIDMMIDFMKWVLDSNEALTTVRDLGFCMSQEYINSQVQSVFENITCKGKPLKISTFSWIPIGIIGIILLLFICFITLRIAAGFAYYRYQQKKEKLSENAPLLSAATEAKIVVSENLLTATILGSELQLKNQIGVGSFGEVYEGRWKGATVAVKRLLMTASTSGQHTVIEDFINEANLMSQLRHPNIIQFLGAAVDGDHLYIVTELADRGSLYDIVKSPKYAEISLQQRINFCIQAARGMLYLHQCRPAIIHRDLKTANLLADSQWNIKVTDFGLSRVVDTHKTMTHCGTVDFCAPEVLKRNRYTTKADVYSFGLVCWQIVTSKDPFYGMALYEMMNKVINEQYRPTLEDVVVQSPALASLINTMWDPDPENRPDFETILTELENIERESTESHNHAFQGPGDGIIRTLARPFLDSIISPIGKEMDTKANMKLEGDSTSHEEEVYSEHDISIMIETDQSRSINSDKL